MVNQMQSMEFAAHQTLHQQTHKQKQKLQQTQAPKIKQEPRNQSQLLVANQSAFRQGAAGTGVGTPSPNDITSVMNHNMNMNISSPPMISDSSVDSVGGSGNTMNNMPNTSIKAMMGQSMCLKKPSYTNAMNQNLGANVLGTGMAPNGSSMMKNIDMSAGMAANPNSCADMDANDVSSLLRQDQNKLLQQQQQLLRGRRFW